jgi:hypothetical protein
VLTAQTLTHNIQPVNNQQRGITIMSIEKNIERIADALEEMVKQRASMVTTVVKSAYPATTPADVGNSNNNVTPISRGKAELPPAKTEPSSVTTTDVELDSDGIPWDHRIHGKARKKLAKEGTWKLIKGVDKMLVESVLAELKMAMAAPAAITPEVPTPPASEPEVPTPPAASTPEVPAPPAEVKYLVNGQHYTADQLRASDWTESDIAQAEQVTADAPPSTSPSVSVDTFPDLMRKITPALAAKTITDAAVVAACNRQGLTSLVLVASRPDLIPAIYAELFPNG